MADNQTAAPAPAPVPAPVSEAVPQGVTLNPVTGQATVPDGKGGVTTVNISTRDNLPVFRFPNTRAAQELIEKLALQNNLDDLLAKAKGMDKHEMTWGRRFEQMTTSNITPIRAVVYVVIGAVGYYLTAAAAKKLAKWMGWNLFGNVVVGNPQPAFNPNTGEVTNVVPMYNEG